MNIEVKPPRRSPNTAWLVNLGASGDKRASTCFRAVDLAARKYGLSKAEVVKQLIENGLAEFLDKDGEEQWNQK